MIDYKLLLFLTEGLCSEAENCIKTVKIKEWKII